jgi:hypothetical protein
MPGIEGGADPDRRARKLRAKAVRDPTRNSTPLIRYCLLPLHFGASDPPWRSLSIALTNCPAAAGFGTTIPD